MSTLYSESCPNCTAENERVPKTLRKTISRTLTHAGRKWGRAWTPKAYTLFRALPAVAGRAFFITLGEKTAQDRPATQLNSRI